MTVNELAAVIGILAASLAISHGRASYWKARAETLKEERSDYSGWESEALFWRRHFNKDAAEAVE